jgi:hypothetical protein
LVDGLPDDLLRLLVHLDKGEGVVVDEPGEEPAGALLAPKDSLPVRVQCTVARYLTIARKHLNYLYGHPFVATPRRQEGKGGRDKPSRKARWLQGQRTAELNELLYLIQTHKELVKTLLTPRACGGDLSEIPASVSHRAASSKLPRRQLEQRRSDCYSRQPEIDSPHAVVNPLFHAGLNIHIWRQGVPNGGDIYRNQVF